MPAYKLVIAEKPSVARDIAAVLGAKERRDGYLEGGGYRVTWCIGHLVQLAAPEAYDVRYRRWRLETLPILPDVFRYEILPATSGQFQTVQRLIGQSPEIICATDAGREGQLIFEYVLRLSRPPEGCAVRRLWISSMTDEAIRAGFASLEDNSRYQRLYQSARCRSEADWLVGINFTRLFTLRYGVKLTVGRVQTPTLALIVQRQAAIEAFVPEPYYQLLGRFGGIRALWHRGSQNRLADRAQALALQASLAGAEGTVRKLETNRKSEDRPLLFDLTELQRESNRRFGYTAQETLDAAQNLYEKHKLITYPRTDSRYLPSDQKPHLPQLLRKISAVFPPGRPFLEEILRKKLPLDGRVIDDGKVSDHHAIFVTERIDRYRPEQLGARERNILELILSRIIVTFSAKKRYDETKLEIALDGRPDSFKASGRSIVEEGWALAERTLGQLWEKRGRQERAEAEAEKDSEADAEKEAEQQILSGIRIGQHLRLDALDLLEKKTGAPKPYTEATLLTAMEKAGRELDDPSLKETLKGKGLGTPATRAGIIEKLISVGYVERRKKNLYPTEQGIQFIHLAPQSVCQVEMTAQWELELQEICDGRGDPERFMAEIRRYVQQTVAQERESPLREIPLRGARRVVGRCPVCGADVIENEKSFYCDGFRLPQKCRFSVWKDNKYLASRGVTLTAEMMRQLLETGKARVDGLTSKAGNRYNAVFFLETDGPYPRFRMEFAPRTPGGADPAPSGAPAPPAPVKDKGAR